MIDIQEYKNNWHFTFAKVKQLEKRLEQFTVKYVNSAKYNSFISQKAWGPYPPLPNDFLMLHFIKTCFKNKNTLYFFDPSDWEEMYTKFESSMTEFWKHFIFEWISLGIDKTLFQINKGTTTSIDTWYNLRQKTCEDMLRGLSKDLFTKRMLWHQPTPKCHINDNDIFTDTLYYLIYTDTKIMITHNQTKETVFEKNYSFYKLPFNGPYQDTVNVLESLKTFIDSETREEINLSEVEADETDCENSPFYPTDYSDCGEEKFFEV